MVNTTANRKGWTDGRMESLKALVKAGLTATQIGKELGVSRGAVLGKAHRMELGAVGGGKKSAPLSGKAANGAIRREPRSFSKLTHPNAHVEPQRPAMDEEPGPHACTLLELPVHACRWPIGDPRSEAFRFCAEPLDPNRDHSRPPYCEHHERMAFAPVSNRKKQSASQLARSLRRYV